MHTRHPTVSVIIPTYNRAGILLRAIASVRAQTFQDYEIILVDDGSTDSTRADIEPLVRVDDNAPRLRYFYKSHGGVASARNLGIQQSRGSLIAFLDSDDAWHPRKLERQVKFLQRSAIAMVHTGRILHRADDNRRDNIVTFPQRMARSSAELLSGTANIAMTVMIKKKVLDCIGPFDESLRTTQDMALWLRVARQFPLAFIDEPLVYSYKLADSNMAANPEQTYRDRITVIETMIATATKAVDRANWNRQLARHCRAQSRAKLSRGKRMSAAYYMTRGIVGYLRSGLAQPELNPVDTVALARSADL